MLSSQTFFASLFAFAALTGASPSNRAKRQSIRPLSVSQINAFTPFTHFASTAYCNPSKTLNWTCGANCKANSDFIPVASGGDGSSTQFWYVGYSPSQETVVLAHQGTDFSHVETIVTNTDIVLTNLNPSLFPGVPSSVEAHNGAATQILSAVQTAISRHSATKVTIVGHSLGGAIALLDGIYLPLHISGVTFRTIAYGCPRVGNQAFANYVDSHIDFTHINNKKDPVPILPGRFLGYVGTSGEVHISESNSWLACPGQDNPSTQCSTGDVPNILEGNTGDHDGPYNGVMMDC
ncbi:hypothetical protein D9756_006169 [Leucocoprinus leucothites]|uniref:Fungal lipase-type domain-containing protein n=1 Tax=Leucocoprinus leucothites TaxID=201217 RepID=A0A8H5FXX5_9AGAR|nr:hypothetical protein D9756_006169 [Leucoagaricus leucothites]